MISGEDSSEGARALGGGVVKGGEAGKRSARTLDNPGHNVHASHHRGGRPDGRPACPDIPKGECRSVRKAAPEPDLVLQVQLPEGWRPPSQAAGTLLRVMIAIRARRAEDAA